MKHRIIPILVLLFSFVATAQNGPNVLFIGNSYTEVNNLPQMVSDIAHSMGDDMTYSSNTPGGCTFQQHYINQSMQMICQGGWDVVVLQEQSQYPSFPQSQVEAEVFPYAEQLVDSIYAHNPCAEPMFYMTWGRRDGDQQNAQYFPVLGTYEGMDSMLCLRYTYMAEANDASLCPVGRVWRYLRANHSDIDLYASDGSHPSQAGTYAAACAFYTLIFHRDPSAITYTGNLTPVEASIIRDAVRTVVYNNLTQWQRPLPEVEIHLLGNIGSNAVSFGGEPQHADSLHWYFGDGTDTVTSANGDLTMQHAYADSGLYTVTLVASRHCMTDTASMEVRIGSNAPEPVGIITADRHHPSVYPNPASGTITVTVDATTEAMLFTADGRQVWHGTVSDNTTIPLHGLAAGVYTLRVGDTVMKVIVK